MSAGTLQGIVQTLPRGLQDHLCRTCGVAVELAERFDVDPNKAGLAALGHDICRHLSADELRSEARRLGIAVHPMEEQVPVLLHGPLAARRMRDECHITDPEVLEAVWWHSTGCAGIGKVGLVVLLADKLDPQKVEGLPHLTAVAELGKKCLEHAVAEYLTAELRWLLERGRLVHPASVDCRNDLLLRMGSLDGRAEDL